MLKNRDGNWIIFSNPILKNLQPGYEKYWKNQHKYGFLYGFQVNKALEQVKFNEDIGFLKQL